MIVSKSEFPIKERLKRNELVIGTWCLIPSPHVINILANSGLDFVLIDQEHGPIDVTRISEMILATEKKCEVFVRVPKNDPSLIQYVLDAGCSGVMIPHVENVADINSAVSYAKYHPEGIRGFSPYTKAGGYANSTTTTKNQNDNVLISIMIESVSGLTNLDKLIDDKNITVVYIGIYDLSVALGVPGDINNRKVLSALDSAIKIITTKGKTVGCMVHNNVELERFVQLGVKFILYKLDTSIIMDTVNSICTEVNKMRK